VKQPVCGGCGKFRLNSVYDISQCRVCWLIAHDSDFRKLYFPEDKEVPSVWKQAVSYIGSLINQTPSPKELAEKRLSLCMICPSYRSDGRCGECGCPVENKVKLEAQKCPLNKW
jgi:hypothetical protein